jgi:2-dehydropantoate 2-reductase
MSRPASNWRKYTRESSGAALEEDVLEEDIVLDTLRCRAVGRRSWTIIGVGGVGGYYGSRLAVAGHPVHWVARSDVDHLQAHGLVVTSPKGDVHLTDLSVSGPDDPLPATDVVVVATKTTTNESVARQVAGAMAGRDGILVVMQNGLDVERVFAEHLADTAPGVVVVGAMSFICASKPAPGVVSHVDYERVTVGAHDPADGRSAGAVTSVVADLTGAGVPCEGLDDLIAGRWRKLVWNIPFSGLSVVLDTSTERLVGDPACRALVRSIMDEVVAAAAGTGHPVDDGAADALIGSTEQMVPYAPSMKLDHDAGRPLELAAIYEAPLTAAARAGLAMPRTEALWRQLDFIDRRNRA